MLKLLKEDKTLSPEEDTLNNDVSKFIYEYKIADGEEPVHVKYLLTLFRRFTKNYISQERFIQIFAALFKFKKFDSKPGGLFYLNRSQLKFMDLVVDYLVNQNQKTFTPQHIKHHIDLFIKTYKAVPAKTETHPELLYTAYKKIVTSDQFKRLQALTYDAFCDALSVLFERSPEGKFLINGNFTLFLVDFERRELERKIKGENQKTNIE